MVLFLPEAVSRILNAGAMLTSVLDFLSMIGPDGYGLRSRVSAGRRLCAAEIAGTSCFRAGGGMVFVFLAMGLGGWLDGSVTSPYAGVATPDGGGKRKGNVRAGKSPVNGVLSVFSGK